MPVPSDSAHGTAGPQDQAQALAVGVGLKPLALRNNRNCAKHTWSGRKTLQRRPRFFRSAVREQISPGKTNGFTQAKAGGPSRAEDSKQHLRQGLRAPPFLGPFPQTARGLDMVSPSRYRLRIRRWCGRSSTSEEPCCEVAPKGSSNVVHYRGGGVLQIVSGFLSFGNASLPRHNPSLPILILVRAGSRVGPHCSAALVRSSLALYLLG